MNVLVTLSKDAGRIVPGPEETEQDQEEVDERHEGLAQSSHQQNDEDHEQVRRQVNQDGPLLHQPKVCILLFQLPFLLLDLLLAPQVVELELYVIDQMVVQVLHTLLFTSRLLICVFRIIVVLQGELILLLRQLDGLFGLMRSAALALQYLLIWLRRVPQPFNLLLDVDGLSVHSLPFL